MANKENEEVVVDFEGATNIPSTNYEKILVPEDSYNCAVKGIEVVHVPDYDKPNQKVTKLAIECELLEGASKGKQIAHLLFPKITKASANRGGKIYSNSKLYDLLVDLGLHDEAKERKEELKTIDGLRLFLAENLVGKTVRCAVGTSKKGKPEAYSMIKKVLRIVE